VAVEIMCLCVAGTEPESTVITQSSIPQLAAQPAPSIMRKRGYEHINGVEGEHCNYSCLALQSVESLSTQGCVLHVAAHFSSIVEMETQAGPKTGLLTLRVKKVADTL